jgi:hypothetical protein
VILSVVMAAFATFVWAIDFVTLQGERTIYTARCQGETWLDDRCTGKLEAAERYRFRALKAHQEVVFWVVGSAEASGRLTPCVIQDGRNWSCKANADASRSITLEMRRGVAMRNTEGDTRTFHAVPKWKWFLLKYGVGQ